MKSHPFVVPLQWQLPSGASAANTKPLLVKTTGVIGAGTMGVGITICLLRAGFPVTLVEQNRKVCVCSYSRFRMYTRVTCSQSLNACDARFRMYTRVTCSQSLNVHDARFRMYTHVTCSQSFNVRDASFRMYTHVTCSQSLNAHDARFRIYARVTCSHSMHMMQGLECIHV